MASVSKRRWTHNGVSKEAWTVRYVDHGGVHRQRTFPKRKEADAYRQKVESDMRAGLLAPQADQITVAKAAEAFLIQLSDRQRDGRIGEEHRIHVERALRLHVLPIIGGLTLAQVNLDRLTSWHREMHKRRKLSPHTGRGVALAIKGVFDFAMRREWIGRNPVLPFLTELRGIAPAKVRTFTMDEMRALLLAVNEPMYRGRRPEAAMRLQCAVHLAAFCGLRIGEIHGLRVENVDFDAGLLRIRNSLSKHDGLKGPKTRAGIRDVAIPRHIAAMLRAWIDCHWRENPAGLMFVNKEGRPRSADGTRHGAWAGLLYRAGLSTDKRKPTFHFHALRHFFASLTIDSGWSLPEVAKTIGHSKVDMTLSVYAHALENKGASSAHMQALSDRLVKTSAQEGGQELRNAA